MGKHELKETLQTVAKETVVLRTYLADDEWTLVETHRTSPMFYVFIDKYLQQRFPERFKSLLVIYEAELESVK